MIDLEELMGELADAFLDNAEGFTCIEADALARAFRTVGDEILADQFMAAHIKGDEHRSCL